jgi:hypothetical protein
MELLALALAAALLPACLADVSVNSAALGAGAPVYIGCYKDGDTRDLPVFLCSNGTQDGEGYEGCNDDSRKKCSGGHWAGGCDMTPVACAALCTGFRLQVVRSRSRFWLLLRRRPRQTVRPRAGERLQYAVHWRRQHYVWWRVQEQHLHHPQPKASRGMFLAQTGLFSCLMQTPTLTPPSSIPQNQKVSSGEQKATSGPGGEIFSVSAIF